MTAAMVVIVMKKDIALQNIQDQKLELFQVNQPKNLYPPLMLKDKT